MQRVHISPRLGDKPVDRVTVGDAETVAAAMLDAALAPKTVRNVVILTAAMTGLRQSELLGLCWRDIDWTAHRIRVRNVHVTDTPSGAS